MRATWSTACMLVLLVAAAGLRTWGLASGELVWHPDEIFMVTIPLGLFDADLNPHQFHYPGLHFYSLGLLYGFTFLVDLATGATMELYEWIALHGLFHTERLRDLARWLSVAQSLGTVAVTAAIAHRLAGRTASLAAAAALAVNVVHVRQAQVASVDPAMTFWFAGAVWASLRLLDNESLRAYLCAGVLVGLAAGTKYPGVAAGAAVFSAHALCRRPLHDRRLWLAGGASLGVFSLVSPFVWLDWATFTRHFAFQLEHVSSGTMDVALPWLHPIQHSLRYALGEPAWLTAGAAAAVAIWRRDRTAGVILGAFAGAWLVIAWGQLVFVRYSLPLLPLQAAFFGYGVVGMADGLSRHAASRRVWAVGLAITLLALPTWRSLGVARVSAATDTRSEARDWLEARVPSGSRLCNFGGWGGDVQLNTHQHLWWLLVRHEEAYGLQQLARVTSRLRQVVSARPSYSYTAGGDRDVSAAGSWEHIDDAQCDVVVLHDHQLPSSQLDSAFVAELPSRATRLAVFSPESAVGDARFDPMDAYYVPLTGHSGVLRPGPRVEIWSLTSTVAAVVEPSSVEAQLAHAHGLLARSAARDGDLVLAANALLHASRYDVQEPGAVSAWAHVSRQLGRLEDAEAAFRQLSHLQPQYADGLEGLARLLNQQGRLDEAIDARREAVRLQPDSPAAHQRLGDALRNGGRHEVALRVLQEALSMDAARAETLHALGVLHVEMADTSAARARLLQAARQAPDNAFFQLDAGTAHAIADDHDAALQYWLRAVELDPSLSQAHRYVAEELAARGDSVRAARHREAVSVLEAEETTARAAKSP